MGAAAFEVGGGVKKASRKRSRKKFRHAKPSKSEGASPVFFSIFGVSLLQTRPKNGWNWQKFREGCCCQTETTKSCCLLDCQDFLEVASRKRLLVNQFTTAKQTRNGRSLAARLKLRPTFSMHLKKLHLVGFKSFAEETTLEFGPGITAVVVPNGSGKSNIVDAMLWALGERSAKALRGHNSTDVIFNGTDKRRATSRAEVNLFFDNESGVLPINFKEVQVSRKLFRDGNGEYGLCGSKCRLRDVLDLFLDTGVGPDAGCIISQGEIDAILSAKPEDRRGLIEGAAGVQKYHSRRSETKKRLEKVVVDLIRVHDIIAELDAQIEPLSRQAEVAREYENLVARLKELQFAVLSRDYLARRQRREDLKLAAQNGEKSVRESRVEIENLERLESLTTRQLRELESRVETLAAQGTELVSRLKSVEGEVAVSHERRKNLSEQQEYGARELGGLRAKAQSLDEQIEVAKTAISELQKSSSGLNQNAAQAEAKLGGAVARLSEATRELQQLQAKIIETMRRGQSGRERLAGGKAEAQSLETRVGELEKLLESGALEAQTLAETRQNAQKILDEIRAKLADQNAVNAARETLEKARQNAANVQKDAANLRENRAKLQSRAGVLRELEESLEGFAGGTKAVLSAVASGDLPDEFRPVADAIRAPRDLELAVEVALGGNLNNLICPDNASAKTAIEFLKRTARGRATFLPRAILKPSFLSERTLDVLRDPGVVGLANELIECAREDEVAVDHLLSRFVIVKSLDDALRLAKRCESGARLVSLEGELVLPAGAITGGQGRQKSSGLLARKREFEEFEEKIGEVEAQIEATKSRFEAAQNDISIAENALRAVLEAQSETKSQFARQEREIETLERDLRRNKTQREAVEGQLRNVKASLSAKNHAFSEIEAQTQRAEAESKALENAVEAARLVVAQRQSEKDEIGAEVAEVRGQFGAQQERQNAARQQLAQLERTFEETRASIRQKQIQIERAAGEDVQIVTRQTQLLADLAQLQEQVRTLDSNALQARSERAKALESVAEIAQNLKSAREKLHGSEEERHRVEVRLASTEAEMSDQERRLRDEFDADPDALQIEENAEFNRRAVLGEIEEISQKIGTLGSVNLGAVAQYEAVKERLDFLSEQKLDLETSKDELDAIIAAIDGRIREQFLTTFEAIREAFAWTFERVFGGGKTHLALTDPENLLETGIELRAQMPGKAAQDISLLSGGERALTALSFMMAILKVRPAPFVILDEVDAPLDQSNVGRFTDLLREYTDQTQFIVITHNNGTMQAADVLYGVTQQEAGVSTLMSVKLAEKTQA